MIKSQDGTGPNPEGERMPEIMKIRERIELHKTWLAQTNDVPLVDTFVAKKLTGGGGGRSAMRGRGQSVHD